MMKVYQYTKNTNKDLGGVLKQQLNAELAIARQALLVANLELKAVKVKKQKENQALTGISDIQERIVGQESEQLVNINQKRRCR
jgi:hypothetical protein